jgi:hypothetical protein
MRSLPDSGQRRTYSVGALAKAPSGNPRRGTIMGNPAFEEIHEAKAKNGS